MPPRGEPVTLEGIVGDLTRRVRALERTSPRLRDASNSATFVTLSASSDFVRHSLANAVGDMLVAEAADSFARLGVGADGEVLTADSGEVLGVKWDASAGGSGDPMRAWMGGL